MNDSRNTYILFFIVAVIIATLSIQTYWNYKNYQTSKQQLINDVQTSLDNAVDLYYTQLATNSSFKVLGDSIKVTSADYFDRIPLGLDSIVKTRTRINIDTLASGLTVFKSKISDSLNLNIDFGDSIAKEAHFLSFTDSIKNPIDFLSSKIIVSFREDELSLATIDSLFAEELARKNITVDYGLSTSNNFGNTEKLREEIIAKSELVALSKSPFFLQGDTLSAHYTNIVYAILKRNLLGIFLSLILVAGIIASLLYLLRIIRQQKQLAELKNDLISNITHEFKTPIATIGVALESIQNFNKENDSEKTERYTNISREQVEKLNIMVEKLLETATLDSEALQLKLESCNVVSLLERVIQKEVFIKKEMELQFSYSEDDIELNIDVFHFENALNNIIDNAIKYGGDKIDISLIKNKNNVQITISDNGSTLTEAHKKQIFEKFYRVPKGNTHDVKGFGIGLYYTKKIIEKHLGSIVLIPQPQTTFKITIPYVQ